MQAMPAAPTGGTARIEEYRRHSSSVAVRPWKRKRTTSSATSWRGWGQRGWKARSEPRRNTMAWNASRQGRSWPKSCTSSLASTRRMQYSSSGGKSTKLPRLPDVRGEWETALSLEYWLQLGPKMKKGAPKRSRKYKKMSSIGKITGTVCRLTHNDGIKRLSLFRDCRKKNKTL